VKHVRFLIIGAGPTGLGAAWRLKELGEHDFLVLDASPEAGGLSRSFRDERGFTWDIGGHVLFSHYPYFDAVDFIGGMGPGNDWTAGWTTNTPN
jgi:UDP-galactopyranose mutase